MQICLYILYGYTKTYNARPYSIHQWRQTDCASFTKNYYEEGMDFFNPKIHWQGNQEGKAISEFPLINYSVACLWKVFGEHEYLYRLTVLAIYTMAILLLFVMLFVTSNSLIYSYFATSLISTSPLLAYYSFNFLADVPSLSFAIIGLSLFFVFLKNKKMSLFYSAILFATLATLLKASSVTVLLIIGCISVINLLGVPKKLSMNEVLFKHKIIPVIVFLISIVIIYSWYHYAFLYNNKNSNGVFLMETLPVWDMKDKVIETTRLLISVQLQMYFNKPVITAILLVFIWLLVNIKAIDTNLKIAIVISAFSFIAFIVLFFQVFNVHDYYLINTMVFPVVIVAAFGSYLANINFNIANKKLVWLLSLVFIGNTAYCASIIRLRMINKDNFCKYYPFITNDEKNFSDWFHYNYETTLKPVETITPYLRSLHIKRTDKVISIPDPSFNITLYLMDQKGFTLTEQQLKNDSLIIDHFKTLGAKYVVINDTSIIHKTNLRKWLTYKIGTYKNIEIYNIEK